MCVCLKAIIAREYYLRLPKGEKWTQKVMAFKAPQGGEREEAGKEVAKGKEEEGAACGDDEWD